MAYDLTNHITRQRRQMSAGLINTAAREIAACPCPDKRWAAMRLLREMQQAIKS